MRITIHRQAPVMAAALTLALTACSGGGGGNDGPITGQLTIGLTDGPVENATAVVIAFDGIELKKAGGPPIGPFAVDEDACNVEYDAATGTCYIDLLQYPGAERAVVFSGELPAGHYEWIRLLVRAERNTMDSYIALADDVGNLECSLYIPSADEAGLRIVSGITITSNRASDFTLDFDVRKSVTNPPGLADPAARCGENYLLKPAIRIVDTTVVGTIAGTVDASPGSQLETSCEAEPTSGLYENVAVYVWEDPDGTAELDDLDGTDDPVTSASVAWSETDMAYEFEVGFLLPGTYRLGLACNADLDTDAVDQNDPTMTEEDGFIFIAERTVVVESGATADGSF